jgi:hypothetical protein
LRLAVWLKLLERGSVEPFRGGAYHHGHAPTFYRDKMPVFAHLNQDEARYSVLLPYTLPSAFLASGVTSSSSFL